MADDTITLGAEPGTDGLPNLLNNNLVIFNGVSSLLTSDSIASFASLFGNQWGVFLGGVPVILFDAFISIDYRQTWNISDYPVERGAFESYNKVQTPFETRVSFASGGSEVNRAALLASVAAIAGTLQLFDVATPEAIYRSVNVNHYDYHRTATNGVGLIKVDLFLEEVRVTISESSTTSSGTDATGSGGGTDTATSGVGASSFDESGFSAAYPSGASPVNNGVSASSPMPGNPSVDIFTDLGMQTP